MLTDHSTPQRARKIPRFRREQKNKLKELRHGLRMAKSEELAGDDNGDEEEGFHKYMTVGNEGLL
jgi:hypothetical protein